MRGYMFGDNVLTMGTPPALAMTEGRDPATTMARALIESVYAPGE